MIETAIRSSLLSSTNVSTLVAADIYFGFAPMEATLPIVVIQRDSTEYEETMTQDGGVATASISIGSYSTKYAEARSVADAVRAVLYSMRATNGIQRVAVDSESQIWIPPTEGENIGIHAVETAFSITYTE